MKDNFFFITYITIVSFSGLLHNYPCSIVALSLIFNQNTSRTFIEEQMKKFLGQKKDPSNYFVSDLFFGLHSSTCTFVLLLLLYRLNCGNAQLNFKVLVSVLRNDDLIHRFPDVTDRHDWHHLVNSDL